ncbi:MAG TPA: protease modulator HflC [Rhodospirillaceae bacterium]|nr:protease modulator HflC [Rhodospirillaceae bacterium]
MKRSGLLFLAIIIAVGGILVFSSMFTVRQDQQALVLQFGSPVEVERTPGLKFKIPFIQNVEYYDRRILDLDPPVQEVILADQKRINVDAFARYRIVDPLEFRKRAGTDANFRQVFGGRLNAGIRSEIGKILLPDMLTGKRAEIMDRIANLLRAQAPEFGVEVTDVRIGRTDLPEATSQAVFNRMRSDRIAEAAELRAKGEEQKTRIQAEAERDKVVILAEARRKSEILRGEGDGERTRVLNAAYGRDAEFFDFYRSLDALGEAINAGTSMVLSPDSELFQFFNALKDGTTRAR